MLGKIPETIFEAFWLFYMNNLIREGKIKRRADQARRIFAYKIYAYSSWRIRVK